MDLYFAKWSYRRIARVMGISHIRVWYIIKRELKKDGATR